jgi:signal transduction histidine kinase
VHTQPKAQSSIAGAPNRADDKEPVQSAPQQSRSRLLRAQRLAGLGFWDWDLSTQRIVMSAEVYRICGLPPGDGQETADIIERVAHPDDLELITQTMQRTIAGEGVYDLTARLVRPDGEICWVNSAAELVRDADGRPLRLLGTLLDITQRKHSEALLRDREQRLQLLHALAERSRTALTPDELIPIALQLLGEHLHASRCAFAFRSGDSDDFYVPHEYTRDGAAGVGHITLSTLGEPYRTKVRAGETLIVNDVDAEAAAHPGALAFASPGVKAVLLTGLVRQGELRAIAAVHYDAPHAWTSAEIAIVQEVAERCWATLEQHAAEARLREKQALVRIASRAARIGGYSIELSPAERITWSDELCELLEARSDALPPTLDEALERYAPEAHELVRARVGECARAGTPFDVELQVATGHGRRAWMRAIGQAERNAQGATTRIHGAVQDIDDRRRLEEQLRQAQKMDAVGQLAGGVAHDFNNLLSVILSYTALIASGLRPEDPLRADIEEIARAGRRASELTQQLLAFSRQQVRQPRMIDLNETVSNMNKMLQRLLHDDITLALQLAPQPLRIFADVGQLEQMIMNLVINARDALPNGGRIALETASTQLDEARAGERGLLAGTYVSLTVNDNGIGMSEATRERIFEPFFTTKDKSKGTGLGLSTVHGIVAQSGGHIEVRSELGRATTFHVLLPAADSALAAFASARPMANASVRGTETVLVVDDEEQVRTIIRAVLARNGYNVLEAQNGGEAFLICEQHRSHIDLLVTDVVMPRMSGRELAARVSVIRPLMRVLYVTGYAEAEIAHHGVLDPGVTVLQKPITPESLLRKVREVLDS